MKKTVSSGILIVSAILIIYLPIFRAYTQPSNFQLKSLEINSQKGLAVRSVVLSDGQRLNLSLPSPLFSVDINEKTFFSTAAAIQSEKDTIHFQLTDQIEGQAKVAETFSRGWKILVTFKNIGDTSISIANFIPLGKSEQQMYITASGPWSLARTKIFRPNLGAVGIILPDNAWDAGYRDLPINEQFSVCALSRRQEGKDAELRRWRAILKPGGAVSFAIWADVYSGNDWRDGLRLMFQERYLYDLDGAFDNHLYERKDLEWIRRKYVATIIAPWDHQFYDDQRGGYQLNKFLEMGKQLFGGWEVLMLWPNWPMLGMDQRNQWDLFRDLPGGLEKVRQISETLHKQDAKFFISYNPWDKSTRFIDPYQGMAEMIRMTNADGVVLDTYGGSSDTLQMAADAVKPGVIMYSEGQATPRDMQGIVTGRVHDAIELPPPLNMHKFIKPDNAIFRVCVLTKESLHREFSLSLFNGYGIEINLVPAGRLDAIEEEYRYLGRVAQILRENSANFLLKDWTPLIPVIKDSIWVNRWPLPDKIIFTVFSLVPEGYQNALFESGSDPQWHWVSLWHHKELKPDTLNGKTYVPAEVNAFDRAWLNTQREGHVDVIARLPRLLEVLLDWDQLTVSANQGDEIRLWAGNPSYQKGPEKYDVKKKSINLTEIFGRYEGKVVVQLMNDGRLLDERVVELAQRTPRLISKIKRTPKTRQQPDGMVLIPAGEVILKTSKNSVWVSPNPQYPPDGKKEQLASFYLDKYPVTNDQFRKFIKATGYKPKDKVNFVAHWKNGEIPKGQENHPVVCVSYEDAQAYAAWAGKRLPTEAEWLYATQGSDGRLWPWGNDFDSTSCNVGLNHPTPVNAYPSGASPFGVQDLVGNVWQMTNDLYDNGSNYYLVLRGGGYYNPTSSWWYVKGGPQPLDQSQILLRVSPGFERNTTIGFRCVKDVY